MDNKKGLTIIELVVSVFMLFLILSFTIPATKSFFSRIEIMRAVHSVTATLSEARYLSLEKSRKIRYLISGKLIKLQIYDGEKWETTISRNILGEIKININSKPIFSPSGTIAPLCSVEIRNNRYCYKVTVSFAGRIKIKKI